MGNEFKRFGDLMKKSPEEMMKVVIRKQHPALDGVEFEVKQKMTECIECKELKIPEYYVKRDHDDDFKKIPMNPGTCISCEDKQLAKNAKENHKRAISERATAQFWVVPPELEEATLATYKPIDKKQANALEISVKYLEDFKKGDIHSLFFRGSYGGGKSHLLKGIAEGIRNSKKIDEEGDEIPYTVGFLELEKLLAMIKGTWGRRDGQSEFDIMKAVIDLDFLVIDDLGNESGEWAGKKVFEIVNGRLGKATAISTNFMNMDELAKRYDIHGGKIVSRLHSNAKIVELVTDDMRMKKVRG